ncbi:hypothetical protein MKW92_033475 [Papaver armeniacum]|nr:hypothetical protein MKW92_033475 [Papaver armeniacum]
MKKFLHFFYDQPVSVATLLVVFLVAFSPIIIYYVQAKKYLKHNSTSSSRTGAPLPEASGAWPVIGHLHHFMKENQLIAATLGDMADKYGPVFSVRFGCHKTLVVSSVEMVKECFTGTNDKLFSNRPSALAFKHMFYGTKSYGFSPYGKYWRELRKISTHKLLSNKQLEKFRHSQVYEVDNSFKKLHELCSNKYSDNKQGGSATSLVRMDDWFAYLTFNVIGRIVSGFQSTAVTGATSSTQENYKHAMDEATHLMSLFAVSDVVPWLGWIDRLTGLTRKMNNCGKKLDAVVGIAVEDHRRKKQRNATGPLMEIEQEDFIDICLLIMEQSQLPGDDPEITVKSIVLDMLTGGTDTTQLILTWTLSLLLNHPDVLAKARAEVDTHFRKKKNTSHNTFVVDIADVPNLVYIQAIIKETMRLYPGSTVIERVASDDCEVGGFHVPAGTRLWVNIWKMQRDSRVWKDASVFRPERFLSDGKEMVDVKGQHYELIPFGTGRRICPGVSFTLDILNLALPRLIFEFDMKAPRGGIDMRARPGLFNYKAAPLDVLITPRKLE